MTKKTFLCTILITLTTSAFAVDKVVAEVNGKKIYKSKLDTSYLQAKLSNTKTPPTKVKLLEELINRELGIEKALKTKIGETAAVKEKLNDILFHAQISNDLENEFKKIKIQEKEVQEYYKEFPEYSTSHLLLRMTVNPKEEERDRMLKAILKIYDEIKKDPKRFEEFAKRFSQAVNAKQGGLMGFLPATHLPKDYFLAIKGKTKGEILAPLRTQFGYHIVKVNGVKKFKDINMNLYKKIIYDQKRDKIIANYFKKLRKSAKIKINKKLIN